MAIKNLAYIKKTDEGLSTKRPSDGNTGGNHNPAATTSPATQPAATQTTTTQKPAKEKSGFTYDPFTYDKKFTYDDFSYDPFTYDKKFTYDDFSYGDFSYEPYSQSATVQQANALLQQQNAAKPGAYQSQWQNEINDYLGQIQNRGPFSYDLNADALYQQYKNNYIQQGQMAMMDTMGQAAAMTGGYGNSYAQTVGQQAYNQQLSQLNNVMPQLYQMAFDRYAYEGDQLQNMYNMYLGLEDQDYGRYMDSMNAWQAERDYLASRYDAERDYDYNKWQQGYNQAYNEYSADRNLAYDAWATGRQQAYNEYSADRSLAYDAWATGRQQAFNEYTADKELAFNEYTADKELAFDQYNTGLDQAWREYLTNQEKEQAAAELMAGTGNYDRLGNVYGLTNDEVAAIKDANTPKYTGGGGNPTPSYKTPTDEQLDKFDKAILDGTFDSDYIVETYEYLYGLDPAFLTDRAGKLSGPDEDPTDTGVDLIEEPKKKKKK